jgi:phosphoserine aminotransferase
MSATIQAPPYNRVFNFSAGPCTLPVEVLEEIRDDLLNYKGCGMSVMELSHRGKIYDDIHNEALESLRKLMNVPSNYKILFLQGGASMQNTMIPMNLLRPGMVGDYIVTGEWGKKTYEAAQCGFENKLVWDGKANNYTDVPNLDELEFSPNASYCHWTSNETIQGVEFQGDPKLPVTSVCDVSSNILSRPMNVSNYDMLYAGAQKNMGPAGVTVVIIKEDLLDWAPSDLHPMLHYKTHADQNSIYNTPPCFAIYVCGLVYKWLLRNGGLEWIQPINEKKAKIIYDAIDNSGGFYRGHAAARCRSLMNVTFTLPSEDLTKQFLKEAEAHKLDGPKGHRSVGGIRASIYNAFPTEGCQALADFMGEFARKNG